MASSVHPRRRPQKATASQMTLSPEAHSMTLRKSQTFNARTSISTDLGSPVSHARYMPRRSPTSPKALEDLVNEGELIAARTSDVAKLLKQFDDKVSGRTSAEGDGSILNDHHVLAVPSFMVQQANVPDPMDLDIDIKKEEAIINHYHESDSGLGSSVASSTIENNTRRSRAPARSVASSHSTITKSASSLGAAARNQHFLSNDAIRHIKKHIVRPILDEESLKEFHPLIEDIPHRIGKRFISNLRDLEKTLFFLAPEFSSSPKSFLKFCETSIECLHTTVDYLCERDQRLPTDRPYTNNYFLDLVEQIRRYAEIMARTREKVASGETLDEMDFSPDEEIAIAGGLSKNGKPAELIRKKDGKVIPLSEHNALDAVDSSPSSIKRSLTDDEMDEEIYRSMARRRKSDKPGDVMHPCGACDKEFKRPCDLTKHEKTHSRPWKCPNESCRYHDQGWPTEKERDRHVNDKHSRAPTLYKCRFPPCTYSSKRESNCKQHMEKAHDWTYVRSKSNGRKRAGDAAGPSNRTSAEPLTPFIDTPLSNTYHNFSSPDSPFLASPSTRPDNAVAGFDGFTYTPGTSAEDLFAPYESRRESITTAGSGMTYSSSNFSPAQMPESLFEAALTPEDVTYNQNIFNDSMSLFGTGAIQQPTPAMSVNNGFDFNDFSNPLPLAHQQHLSPTGQADLTLYSPHSDLMIFDEGLGGNDMDMGFGRDFQLFGTENTNVNTGLANLAAANWFPETTTMCFDSMNFQDAYNAGQ